MDGIISCGLPQEMKWHTLAALAALAAVQTLHATSLLLLYIKI
jgi:hypothetical protein